MTLIIEGLDPVVAERLTRRAQESGATVEEEARRLLSEALTADEPISATLHRLFKDIGLGADESIPELRGATWERVSFSN